MITFKESIEIKNTIKLAEKCFHMMESYKISSINFVDWIESSCDDNQDINENLRLWLQTEINFLENYDSEVFEEEDITFGQSLAKDFDAVKNSTIGKKIGQWGSAALQGAKQLGSAALQGAKQGMQQYSAHSDVQSMAKNVGIAKQKLTDLFKRGERQGSILSNDKIKTALSNIINMLQKIDPSTIGRTPQPANANKEFDTTETPAQKELIDRLSGYIFGKGSADDYIKRGEIANAVKHLGRQGYSNEEIEKMISAHLNASQPAQPAQPNMANVTFNGQPSGGDAKQITPFDRTTTKTGNLQTNSFSPIGQKLFETRIKSICYKLDELKINPYHFATCFVDEFCEDNNINESGFIGGAWSGLKGAVKGGWDRLMGGGEGSIWDSIQGGYRSGRDSKYDDYDRQAIADAIKHLGNFSKQIEGSTLQNFQQQINGLITNLNKTLTYKPQQNVAPQKASAMDMDKLSASSIVPPTDQEKRAAAEEAEKISNAAIVVKNASDKSLEEKIDASNEFWKIKTKTQSRLQIQEKWAKLPNEIKAKVIDLDAYKKIIADEDKSKSTHLPSMEKGKLYKKILKFIDDELALLPQPTADMKPAAAAAK
jgi:hypothetical protein